jgi:RNA polymerase sigma-70 factor (ECF subfamily)
MKDEEIVARIRNGDDHAARALLDRYRPVLRGRVRNRMNGKVRRRIAESDVIQEAFIAVMNRLDDFEDRGEGSFGRWLNSVLEHKILDQLRRHVVAYKRSVDHEETNPDTKAPDVVSATRTTPSQRIATDEAVRAVHNTLQALPDDYRRVLTLVHFNGLKLNDAALSLQRSEAATRSLYGRALRRLRAALEDQDRATS